MRINPLFITAGVAALLAMLYAGLHCNGTNNNDNPIPVIGNGEEYKQVLAEAERVSKEAFMKLNSDEPLTPEDRSNLSKATSQFQSLGAFEPNLFAPYLGLGMSYRGQNEPEMAEKMFRLCLERIPLSTSPEIVQTSAEAHYQLSRALFDQKKYDFALAEAATAIETVHGDPNYLTARAAAYMQLKRLDEARKDLNEALKLDPNHRRASALKKLLH